MKWARSVNVYCTTEFYLQDFPKSDWSLLVEVLFSTWVGVEGCGEESLNSDWLFLEGAEGYPAVLKILQYVVVVHGKSM